MRIRRKQKLKLLAGFLAISLIGVASADLLSRALMWNLQVDDAEYVLSWETAELTSMSVLASESFTLRIAGPDNAGVKLLFIVESMPVGATYDDLELNIMDGVTIFANLIPDINGEAESPAIAISGGFNLIDFEVSIDIAGAWQFTFVLITNGA